MATSESRLDHRRALVLAVVAASTPCAAVADPTGAPVVNFRLEHYPVTGRTLPEIQASIGQNAPSQNGDTYYAGTTVWRLGSTYDFMTLANGGCALTNPQVTVNITISLPTLQNDQQRSLAVLREWNRFYTGLRAHEMLHAANGKRTAQILLNRLSGVRTELPCDRLRVVVSDATQALIKQLGQYDTDLDRQTNHGATQGAALDLNIQ